MSAPVPTVTEILVTTVTNHYAGDCVTLQGTSSVTNCYSCPAPPSGTYWQYPTPGDPYDCYERIYTYVANYHRTTNPYGCQEADKVGDGQYNCP